MKDHPWLIAVIWSFLILFGLFTCFWYISIRPHTADYMLNTTAPPYMEQAEDFFYTNQDLIAQMEPLFPDLDELDDDGENWYIFFPTEEYQSDLPAELIAILSKMEVTPEQRYVFEIDRAGIRFRLYVDVRLWIEILYDSPYRNQEDAVRRWADLDDHWAILAHYLTPA